MFFVCLVLNEVFLIVCCNTPNPNNKAINYYFQYRVLNISEHVNELIFYFLKLIQS